MEERRRHPRQPVDHELATLPAILNAQVLDISVDGALLQVTRRVDVGTRGVFRLNLGGRTFSAQMQVRRVTPARAGGHGFLLGARFVDVGPADEQLLEWYMAQ